MTHIALALVVLRVSKMEASLAFYRALGLLLTEEKHGTGPVHFSCQLGATVLEIYPGEPHEVIDYRKGGATMLGFEVDSMETTLAAFKQTGAPVLTSPRTSAWGIRAVIQDPDGRAVEITQPLRG